MYRDKLFNQKIYDSAARPPAAIEEIKSLFLYKDLIIQLIRRDLVSRYKRSVLGVAWTMLNPLGTMLVMTIVFSRVFNRVESYPAYVLSGLLIWNFFSQTTRHCMDSTLWGSNLFGKIYLPRTAFIISSIGTGLVNLVLSMLPLTFILLITGVAIRPTALLFPLAVIPPALFSLGVGLLLSTYSVYFPDIAEIYSIFLTAWMYFSPVVVPEDVLAGIANRWILKLNPLYYFIKIFRITIYDNRPLSPRLLVGAVLVSCGIAIIGWLVFTKESDKFAYHL